MPKPPSYSVGPFRKSNNNDCGVVDDATSFLHLLQRQVPTFLSRIIQKLQQNYNIDVSHYEADHVCWRTETIEEYNHLVGILKQTRTGNKSGTDGDHNTHLPPFKLLIESMIGGRPIATFEICHPDNYIRCGGKNHHVISVIEIPSPKKGETRSVGYKSGLEHVEFVIGRQNRPSSSVTNGIIIDKEEEASIITSPMNDKSHQVMFEEFITKLHCSGIPWNEKARYKDINPDISITLSMDDGDDGSSDDNGNINDNDGDDDGTSEKQKQSPNYSVKFHAMPLKDVIEYEKLHNKVEPVVVI